jgi:membrane protease YdiL (CAAX protease family)
LKKEAAINKSQLEKIGVKKTFWLGIAIWLLYFVCRLWVTNTFPDNSWNEFLIQDWCLSGFRFLLFILILALAKKQWTAQDLGFRKGPLVEPMIIGLLMICGHFYYLLFFYHAQNTSFFYISEIVINLLVATNEEISFRGLFFKCLLETKNRKWAEYGSALLFTLMHVTYQPWLALPGIFTLGLIFSKLRTRGVSLTVLILIHWFYDILWFLYMPGGVDDLSRLFLALFDLIPLGLFLIWKAPTRQEL